MDGVNRDWDGDWDGDLDGDCDKFGVERINLLNSSKVNALVRCVGTGSHVNVHTMRSKQ